MPEFDFEAWLAEHRASLDAESSLRVPDPATLCCVCAAPRTAGVFRVNPATLTFFCRPHIPPEFACLTRDAYVIRRLADG